MMPLRHLALAAALLLAACAPPPPAPTELSGSMRLGGREFALPPGPWRVLRWAADHGTVSSGRTDTTIHRALLVQERVQGAVAVLDVASLSEPSIWWGFFRTVCTDNRALARVVEAALPGDVDCRGVSFFDTAGSVPSAHLQPLFQEGMARPGWLPPRWLVARTTLVRQGEGVFYSLWASPAALAPEVAAEARWNAHSMTAPQQAAVARLDGWLAAARPSLRQSLDYHSPAPLPAPFRAGDGPL
jgi:hypothetical protein